jgi:hypothetical protein
VTDEIVFLRAVTGRLRNLIRGGPWRTGRLDPSCSSILGRIETGVPPSRAARLAVGEGTSHAGHIAQGL